GWIWILRFNNGITSAGVAATDGLANALRFAEGEAAWNRLLGRLPSVREQFSEATSQRPFVHTPRLSFRSATVNGGNWALLPSASFGETARRLRRPELARGFLLSDHPDFGPRLRSCCERVLRGSSHGGLTAAARASLIEDVYQAIEPFDVAGLCARDRCNWH